MLFSVFFLFLFNCFFFFLLVGFLTVLERKVIAFFNCRKGPDLFFKGVMVFVFDFFKLCFKYNQYDSVFFYSFFCVFFLFFMFNLLPVSLFGYYFSGSYLLLFFLEFLFVFFKILFCSSFCVKFLGVSFFRFRLSSLVYECFFFVIVSPFFLFCFNNELYSWRDICFFFGFFDCFFFVPLFFLYFFLFVFGLSRSPFDYLECESECVGGVFTGVGGSHFVLWSFIEYGEIVFRSCFCVSIFFCFCSSMSVFFSLLVFILIFFLLVFRSLLVRYDYYSSFSFIVSRFGVICFTVSIFYIFIVLCLLL